MTHTPGPWRLNKDRVSVAIPYRGEHCVTSTYGGTEANARLIAAAPDHHSAAREIDRLSLVILSAVKADQSEQYDAVVAAILANRAAIARATTASKEGEA